MKKKKEGSIAHYFIKCPVCGYNNYKNKVKKYGICLGCGISLNSMTKFKKIMKGELK